ncbi:diagnostic antigen gp50 [Echinococcus multilocularis]|uniref:Diagnostic antigen gp50 n=1 Tax=Echinococcus multilocularis TaxID=6211 RepID=A0A068XZK5_ECHMU|nr:diagnostic antigen gp50 [Echinococcus multilocularis]
MLAIIAVLLCVACCSGETSPHLWGSRVVGKPSGKSDTMNYRYGDQFAALVLNATTEMQLTIVNGNCMVNGAIWGTPCQDHNGTVNITLNDVNTQKVLWTSFISNGSIFIVTTFFVPYCNFSQPSPDEVDLKSSFPLSRFVQGQQSFPIDFAVGGAESNGGVSLDRNGTTICEWSGVTLVRNISVICVNLVKNETADLRIFHANFTSLPNVQQEVLTWKTAKSRLSVTVDYAQSGISPEVAECNKYKQEQTSTTSSGPAQTHTTGASTTSSGKCASHCIFTE